jgi:heme A synthase
MRQSAIRLSMLVITTMMVGAATITPVRSEVHHGKQIKKHRMHVSHGFSHGRTDRAWAAVRSPGQAALACPRVGRSFECDRWPPPIDEDPDRVISGSSGD